MLRQKCPSLLSEFQFLITHIQAAFLPPTVHLGDCAGHHNFLADDLWYLFKQCLMGSGCSKYCLHGWCLHVFGRVCNPKASSYPAEIVGSRSVESNPSCCRAKRTTYTLAGLTGSRIWREILPQTVVSRTLSKATQIEMGFPYLLPCAPCSAVILTESDPSKGPGQSKRGGQLAVQHSTFRPILMNFRPELRFWTVLLNFRTSCEYGGMIVSQFISSTWRHS